MEVIIFIIVIISFIVSASSKAKKMQDEQQQAETEAAMRRAEHNRRLAEQERARRAAEEKGATATVSPQVTPHVAPHAPTVHAMTEDPDCDAHRKPFSSEGSPVRAHAHTAQDTDCDAHSTPVSTEGETKEEHLERLRRLKAEREAQLAEDARYDEAERQSRIEAKIRQPEYVKTKLTFGSNAVLQGIIYSEILKPPMCKRGIRH